MARLQNSFSMTTILCLLLLSSCLVCEASLHKLLMRMLSPQNTCQSNCCQMTCPQLNCGPNQVMKHNADWSGCCPMCVTQLQMGNPCQPKSKYPWPMMQSSECCQGLKCKQGKCCN